MYSLLRRRTMMTKPSVVPTERLIYQLYDYTCDGTINTFIDTGIKLFGLEYVAFRIEIEFDNLVYSSLATVLECKAFGQTYNNGLCFRCSSNNMQVANLLPVADDVYFSPSNNTLSVICNRSGIGSITGVNNHQEFFGEPMHNEPLTIGGRYSSHLSNPDRFVQVHISSLKIYATPSGVDPTYINLPLTFKCLTGGDLSIKNTNGSYDRNFEYSLNGGAWTAFELPKNTASKLIATLSPNDTISFRRDNDNFADTQFLSDSNLTFDIYGNLLSLQYGSAFSGQMDLRNASKKAFGAIFSGINVVDASKLMLTASTLSSYCYDNMFSGCSGLISAPCILPAMNVPSYAYSSMFKNCSSLSKAPIIWASNIAGRAACYYMFQNCTSLVTIPEFEINSIGDIESCQGMFDGCTSLTTAPKLNATTLKNKSYRNMFRGCTSLTTAPNLPATTIGQECYKEMFSGCISLTIAPNRLPATTLAKSCYELMFVNCTSLTTAPELPATTIANTCYCGMFNGCSSLTAVPNLPATTLAQSCYESMFRNCTSLVNAPELPATTLADYCYYEMFYGCTSLTTAPELHATNLKQGCYKEMFKLCTNLTTAPALPSTTLATNCYSNMFANCSSLLTAPELPAKTLVAHCYTWMFHGCSQLSYVKCLATDGMVYDNIAEWLQNVSNTGTFVKASGVTWPSGSNGIPNGWTVIEE